MLPVSDIYKTVQRTQIISAHYSDVLHLSGICLKIQAVLVTFLIAIYLRHGFQRLLQVHLVVGAYIFRNTQSRVVAGDLIELPV